MEKALIIEDDKYITDLIANHLSDLEFVVDKVYDGKEGLFKALNNTYKTKNLLINFYEIT